MLGILALGFYIKCGWLCGVLVVGSVLIILLLLYYDKIVLQDIFMSLSVAATIRGCTARRFKPLDNL